LNKGVDVAFLDIFALILILAGVTRGLALGIKKGFASFSAVLASFAVALTFSQQLEGSFDRIFKLEGAGLFAAYLSLLVFMLAITWGFAWAALTRRQEPELPLSQRWAGAVVGLMEGLVYLLAVTGLFLFQPWFPVESPFFAKSVIFKIITNLVPYYSAWVI
jgi:uncharacterized membrane protein required for colicin V production